MSEPIEPASDLALTPSLRSRRRVGMLALAAIIFICGGATGWGVRMLIHRPPPPMGMGPAPEPPVSEMVDRLRQELLLTDDQAEKVRKIYQERNDSLQAIREAMGPQLKSQYDKLNEQMKSVLTPQQFQRWNERFQNMRSRMLPPPPRPPRPGGPEDGGPPMGPEGRLPPPPDRGPPFGMPPP